MQAVNVAELMVTCLSHRVQSVAEAVIEYLDEISYTPTAERHASLQHPLYGAVLMPLLSHAQLPESFNGWEDEVDIDEDSFNRFRCLDLQWVGRGLFERRVGRCKGWGEAE